MTPDPVYNTPVIIAGSNAEVIAVVGARLGAAVLAGAVLGGMAFTLAILIGGASVESAVHRLLHPHSATDPRSP